MLSRQVFFDPTGRRRRITNVVGLAAALGAAAGLTMVLAGLLAPPSLPVLESRSARLPTLADGGGARLRPPASPGFAPFGRSYAPSSARDAKRFGFFDVLDGGSHASLRKNARALDALLPDFLLPGAANGEIGRKSPDVEDRLRRWLKREAPGLEIYPVLSSDNRPSAAAPLLASPAARASLAAAVAGYLEKHGDAGVALALSDLPPASHAHVVSLAGELTRMLAPAGRKVIVIVPATADRSQVQELAQAARYVLVTLHQEFRPGKPEPAASQAWFEAQLARLRPIVEPGKLIVGLGSFARDWGSPGSPLLPVESAWSLMKSAGAALAFDGAALNPRFRYAEPGGLLHDVWLLDGATVFNQMKAALMERPAGVALWRLGYEDQGAWASFRKGSEPGAAALSELARLPGRLHPGGGERRAEVLTFESPGAGGARSLDYDGSLGLVVRESISLGGGGGPAAWKAADPMQAALTFDDGPDPAVTPRILDALAAKSVKATFFVVGRNALRNPGLLRRIHDEGHDLGNHTFSHPRLSAMSAGAFALELNAAQRTLEVLTGVHTTLFRPPYTASMGEPESLAMAEAASRLGYVTVMAGVDPLDWAFPQPPPERIRDLALTQILGGRGQIICLHDWGKKQATVEALPLIIDGLRAKGFRLVTIHELMGRGRSDVMPAASSAEAFASLTSSVRASSMLVMNGFNNWLPWLAMAGSVLGVTRLILVIAAALRHRRRERERAGLAWRPSSVAVIAPAYNEEKVICKTIASVLASRWADLEIIVVDDGSTDGTADAVRRAYAGDGRVRLFVKANGGKASAANFALARTSAEVVVCLDADTVLAPDAIPLLVRHFGDPGVGAVAGTAVVGNEVNLLTRFQAVEYLVGQQLDRRAFAMFNAVGIVPGAIGAWRREALLAVGGYASDTVAEDADATFSVTRAGWKVLYEPEAEAFTEAPEGLRGFLKQRRRWMFGMLQVISKHIGAAAGGPRGLGWLTIPNVIVFQFGFSFLIPVLDAAALGGLLSAASGWLGGGETAPVSGSFQYMRWWLLFMALDFAVMFALLKMLAVRGGVRVAALVLLQRFLYWPLIHWTAWATSVAALKGRIAGWNKLRRTGSVQGGAVVSGSGAAR